MLPWKYIVVLYTYCRNTYPKGRVLMKMNRVVTQTKRGNANLNDLCKRTLLCLCMIANGDDTQSINRYIRIIMTAKQPNQFIDSTSSDPSTSCLLSNKNQRLKANTSHFNYTALLSTRRGCEMQWSVNLTRNNRWMPVRSEFEPHQRLTLFSRKKCYIFTQYWLVPSLINGFERDYISNVIQRLGSFHQQYVKDGNETF